MLCKYGANSAQCTCTMHAPLYRVIIGTQENPNIGSDEAGDQKC